MPLLEKKSTAIDAWACDQKEKMVKLSELKLEKLNALLERHSLSATGTKANKIARRMDVYETGEVQDVALECEEVPTLQKQVEELREMIANMSKVVADLVSNKEVTYASHTTAGASRIEAEAAMQANGAGGEGTPPYVVGSASATRPTTVKHTMSDIIGMLPDFDPLKGQLSTDQFLDRIEQLRSIYGWSEEILLFAVHHRLQGVARQWAESQPVFRSWQQFVASLRYDFPTGVTTADVHREMANRRRRVNEDLKDYYYVMLNLGRKINMDEASINSYVIGGLNDVSLYQTLMAMNMCSCNELLRSIKNLSIGNTYNKVSTVQGERKKR